MTPIKIRNISVEVLLQVLSDLYTRGVDFIDLEGEMGEEEDKLGVSFKKEYMNPEYMDTFENFNDTFEEKKATDIEVKKLSDEDLNQII